MYRELDKGLKNDLRNCSHSSESFDLMWLHLEQTLVGTIYHFVQTLNFEAFLEQERNWCQQSGVDDEHLIHEEHVHCENWEN